MLADIGPGARLLPSSFRLEVAETCRCWDGSRWFDREKLLDHEWDVHHLYRGALNGAGDMHVRNIHAHDAPFTPALLRWSLSLPFADALEQLRPLTEYSEDWEGIELEHTPDGRPEAQLWWYERGPTPKPADCRQVGLLYLDEGRLAAEVATEERADALAREVAARFGSAATLLECRRTAQPSDGPRTTRHRSVS